MKKNSFLIEFGIITPPTKHPNYKKWCNLLGLVPPNVLIKYEYPVKPNTTSRLKP